MKTLLTICLFLIGINCFAEDNPATADSLLKGKIVNVIGDSYVYNHRKPKEESWHCKVAAKLGMTYNNYGRNGDCIAFDRKDRPAIVRRYWKMDKEADLVLIIAGHNDAYRIGHDEDSVAMFREALVGLIDSIRKHCPKAKVGYVTPWYVDYEGFIPIVGVIREVCKEKSVPLLDNYNEDCVIKVRDPEFRARNFQGPDDKAHLNSYGHDLFAPVGEAFILQVMNGGGQ